MDRGFTAPGTQDHPKSWGFNPIASINPFFRFEDVATNTALHKQAPAQVMTCILKFPDGQQVLGRIRQTHLRQRSPIIYVGDTKRLNAPCKLGTIDEL